AVQFGDRSAHGQGRARLRVQPSGYLKKDRTVLHSRRGGCSVAEFWREVACRLARSRRVLADPPSAARGASIQAALVLVATRPGSPGGRRTAWRWRVALPLRRGAR